MIRVGFFLGALWFAGTAYLLVLSISRWLFDGEPPVEVEMNRHTLFAARIFVAMFWWLMLLSQGGRDAIVYIMQGKLNDE